VYSRRQFCGDLEVYCPPEPFWNPRLREAATTLGASGRQRGGKSERFEKKSTDRQQRSEKSKVKQNINRLTRI